MTDGWRLDLAHALRALRRTPTFTVAAVLILGLGIGMSTAMFTVFDAVVLQRLPVQDPDRLVTLWTYRDPTVELPLAIKDLDVVRRESRTLRGVAGFVHWGAQAVPVTEGDRSLLLKQAMVTANFFDVLGARPVLGRLFRPDDGVDSAAGVVVISYQTWRREFGGDPGVIGRRLTTTQDLKSRAIVGVAPPGLDYPVGTEYWMLPWANLLTADVVGRLAPGVTVGAARGEFLTIAKQIDGDRPAPVHPLDAAIHPLTETVIGDVRPILLALSAAVALLLLIACTNVGNLLLLRASLRSREIAIRRALGASGRQVARLLLLESVFLGMAGGGLGVGIAVGLLRALLWLAPDRLPRMELIGLAGAPLGIALMVTTLAVAIFGIVPALAAGRGSLATTLRLDSRAGTETQRRGNLRQWLVAAQTALAVVMLTGAGLLLRSLERLERLDLGYQAEHLSIVELAIPYAKYDSEARLYGAYEQLYRQIGELRGVVATSPILYRAFVGANMMVATPMLEGQTAAEVAANPQVPLEAAGPGYFRTFGIPIVKGRGLAESDGDRVPKVAVVTQAAARLYWPGQDPIGRRFKLAGDSTEWRTVVGVSGDIRFRRLQQPTPMIVLPWRQLVTFGVIAVRTEGELGPMLAPIRRAVHQIDPSMEVWRARTMDENLAQPLATPRLSTLLLSAFGVVALLLVAIGLYGVMASAVRERTRELGIRMALGATPARLRRAVLGSAVTVTGAGVAVGLVAAVAGSRLLRSLLFEVSPTDPVTLGLVTLVLVLVAALAAYVPARRVTRVDPMEALRG